ncbi:MAG: hypothetical protein A2504_10040 [Bdellovibrionales bacterium RIFOXYD12_FULL_39_22]|nr:MAG: hypothetical protein A2385_17675 [Bdellovibrionales bacterium RIFOXYB1_FULL_39_21]OFZ43949.1 MAG: hypothetical protein A2485_04345 [Bdellovibrionales bacterium RIFOXYC12_FULL_39_17]OFZ48321.1 MAG: hypothetical protein A2404_01760 [Bdellovibrionales bacterium RIFOXYC1_FULL_39_130]OFZ76626.1 MAG: hypothetical protein A2560_17355 [Bdellovibrionales bacterium RIFOXYD1_FULL_39_84]OFZ94912.1 MAG: hypothetical protein A2504_10040 [Bdellovibrionales bacterium RIFOXYD12_FULL_39_22]
MKLKTILALSLCALFIFSACKKDEQPATETAPAVEAAAEAAPAEAPAVEAQPVEAAPAEATPMTEEAAPAEGETGGQ